jgi:hypothetical protein
MASQKAALSLLISVFLFCGIAVLAYTGLFDLVETRFYSPSLIKSLSRETDRDAQLIQEFFSDLQGRFSASLDEPSVRRSFLPSQSAEDIFERSKIYGTLLESLGGLQAVRFVDFNGTRLHFSTYSHDILSEERLYIAYRNYNENPQNLPFEQVRASAGDALKLVFDNNTDRIIFSFPFYDSLDVFRGTALFNLSVRAVAEWLTGEGRIKIGEDLSLSAEPPGIVTGSPGTSKDAILARVSSIWGEGLLSLTPFESDAGNTLALISAKTSQGVFYGRLINGRILAFPQAMKVILLVSIFLTVYLTVFLLFNIKQDNMTIVQNRMKSLQVSLIENFYQHKGDMDWDQWAMELEQRREGIRSEVKRGLKFRRDGRSEENIDALVDRSWDELLTLIGGRKKAEAGLDEAKLKDILKRVLQESYEEASISQPLPAVDAFEEFAEAEVFEKLDEVEAFESLAEAEPVEEFDEVEAFEVLDETEAIEEFAEMEAFETLAEADAEAIEELVEELAGTEAIEELAEAVEEFEEAAEEDETTGTIVQQPASSPKRGGLLHLALEYNAARTSGVKVMSFAEQVKTADSSLDDESFPVMAKDELDILASKIEFGTETIAAGNESESALDAELEIVSPFSSLFSSLKGKDLQRRPGLSQTGLKDVILEQDGITFINQDAFNTSEELEIDKDFKKLVDSVLEV